MNAVRREAPVTLMQGKVTRVKTVPICHGDRVEFNTSGGFSVSTPFLGKTSVYPGAIVSLAFAPHFFSEKPGGEKEEVEVPYFVGKKSPNDKDTLVEVRVQGVEYGDNPTKGTFAEITVSEACLSKVEAGMAVLMQIFDP